MGDELTTIIGGVTFYASDVERSETGKAKNGKTLYTVFLKNGTKMRFYDQDAGAHPYVMTGNDKGNDFKYGTAFYGIMGMSIEGSKEDDYYHLKDCHFYNVNVEGGGNDEVRAVCTDIDYVEPVKANVKTDSGDNAYVVDYWADLDDAGRENEGVFLRDRQEIIDGIVAEEFARNPVVASDDAQPELAQPLVRDIPEDKARKYNGFNHETQEFHADSMIINGDALFPAGATEEEDGSKTYSYKKLGGGSEFVNVNVKQNEDGTTVVTRTSSWASIGNVAILDTKTGTILYEKFADGTQNFYNADGSTTVYDKDNKFVNTIPPFEGGEE